MVFKDVDEARRIVGDRGMYDKYQETAGPTAYAAEAGFHAAQRGGYTGKREDWEKLGPSGAKDSPAEKGEAATVGKRVEEISKEYERVAATARDLAINMPMAQSLYRENQLGGSKLSGMTLAGRKILGTMFLKEGEYDEKVVQSEGFFAHLGENVLKRSKEFPGALSNDDRIFLSKLTGDLEMSPRTIRDLLVIREKLARSEIREFNKKIEGHKTSASQGMRGAIVPYLRKDEEGKDKPGVFDAPDPGKLLQQDFERRNGCGTDQGCCRHRQAARPRVRAEVRRRVWCRQSALLYEEIRTMSHV